MPQLGTVRSGRSGRDLALRHSALVCSPRRGAGRCNARSASENTIGVRIEGISAARRLGSGQIDADAAGEDLRLGEGFGDRIDRSAGDAAGFQCREQFGASEVTQGET